MQPLTFHVDQAGLKLPASALQVLGLKRVPLPDDFIILNGRPSCPAFPSQS